MIESQEGLPAKKPRKSRAKPTQVEVRIRAGSLLRAEVTGDAERPVSYTFLDTGKAARSDIVAKLIAQGVLVSQGDSLFDGFAQTWGLAQ